VLPAASLPPPLSPVRLFGSDPPTVNRYAPPGNHPHFDNANVMKDLFNRFLKGATDGAVINPWSFACQNSKRKK
jgi:hypothetical protein